VIEVSWTLLGQIVALRTLSPLLRPSPSQITGGFLVIPRPVVLNVCKVNEKKVVHYFSVGFTSAIWTSLLDFWLGLHVKLQDTLLVELLIELQVGLLVELLGWTSG
jgi:hypothetical protein